MEIYSLFQGLTTPPPTPPSPAKTESFELPYTRDPIEHPDRTNLPRCLASWFFSNLKTRDYREHRPAAQAIRSIAWNMLGNRIACGMTDKLVRVWNPEKPEIKNSTELKGHSMAVEKVAWDPTHADRLASCGIDGNVKFWDYRSKQCLATIPTHGETISLVWHPDGTYVAAGTKDGTIYFIDTHTHTITQTHHENKQTNELLWAHNGAYILLTTGLGEVVLREWPSLEHVYTTQAHSSSAHCLELDPRGAHLAVGGSDAVVSIWDPTDWVCERTLTKMEYPVRTLSFSFDGAYIAAGSDEIGSTNIDIAHVDTGDYVHTILTNHSVPNVAWHPNKYWLAYSGDPLGLKIVGAAGP
ncbi:hypothetical protein RUND412_000660 [Rhizina undulata]